MSRPIDIKELLKRKDSTNGDNFRESGLRSKVQKPKFLNKNKLSNTGNISGNQLVETDGTSLYANLPTKVVKTRVLKSDELNSNESIDNKSKKNKRSEQFSFDWDQNDDTLNGSTPITSLRAKELLKNEKRRSGRGHTLIESNYMGKHWSEKNLDEMTERDWRIVREDFQISYKGGNVKNPLINWEDDNWIPSEVLNILKNVLKLKSPTPIQRVSIPNVCSNLKTKVSSRDFMGIASTGSGKTLSFMLPIIIKLLSDVPRSNNLKVIDGPKALIIGPTRELVQQIHRETEKITYQLNKSNHHISACSIVGGHSLEEITISLRNGCDILIVTPGRFIDCLENHLITVESVETLVFDEADKMIDLGFEEQLHKIMSYLSVNKEQEKLQTLMFSATMSSKIEQIASGFLKKAVVATIGSSDQFLPRIQQIVEESKDEDQKFNRVLYYTESFPPPMIIFVNYKTTADWLLQKFQTHSRLRVTVLHGSKSQEQREVSLNMLRNGKAQVMIATNVAARGIDVPNVSLVINFQMSKNFDDYIHRIGRTGRAGSKGTAVSFVEPNDEPNLVLQLHKYVAQNEIKDALPSERNKFSTTVKQQFKLESHKSRNAIID